MASREKIESRVEIRVQRKMGFGRLVAGATISALGFYLLTLGRELSGLALVVLGFVISFPRSLGAVVTTILLMVYAAVWVGVSYWVSNLRDDVPFGSWLIDNKFFVLYAVALMAFHFGSYFFHNRSMWSTLLEDYGEPPADFPTELSADAVDGLLWMDEDERIDVAAIATDAALILTREKEGSIFFAWDRIRQIRVRDESPHIADIEIIRRTPVPLRLGIPWSKKLAKNVPVGVEIIGA